MKYWSCKGNRSKSLEPLNVTFQGKKDSTDGVKVKIVTQGSYAGLARWVPNAVIGA